MRTPVEGVSVLGRNTQGVRLINIGEDEKLVGVEPVAEYQGDNGDAENGDAGLDEGGSGGEGDESGDTTGGDAE